MDKPDEHFHAVVVGSGFGGSVVAQRLADADINVCLLERGRAYAPGTFARTPREMGANFWDPRSARYGLFDAWAFRHLNAIVSAGLGGGSLIYANVLIRKDEHWFVRDGYRGNAYEYWPITRAELDPHYERVEKMLDAQVYPFDRYPYCETSKTLAMEHAARTLDIGRTEHATIDPARKQWYLPLLAVSFSANGRTAPGQPLPNTYNIHGVRRQTCRLCGECDIGCNYGSKNTLDLTYLSQLNPARAQIRTLAEVIGFERRRDKPGYAIRYVVHDSTSELRGSKSARAKTISADILILSCGTLGTNFLMLKHNAQYSDISPTLGTRFCGNGDVINFVFNCKQEPKAGGRRVPRYIDSSRGPVITSTFRFPDSVDNGIEAGRGLYLQDAGYPLIVDWLIELADVGADGRRLARTLRKLVRRWMRDAVATEIGGDLGGIVGKGTLSATSLALLCMGREEPDGILRLSRGRRRRLQIDWSDALAKPYFDRVLRESRAIGSALGGSFVPDPLTRYLNRLITVHPVGGCPMGRNVNEGVVDSYGKVFGHDDLYVVDGSIMPGPVGPNPSLTIAALADRAADSIIDRRRSA